MLTTGPILAMLTAAALIATPLLVTSLGDKGADDMMPQFVRAELAPSADLLAARPTTLASLPAAATAQ